MTKDFFTHKRYNEQAGENDFFFPMEIEDESGREFARANGLQIVTAMLGCRVFDAVEIPCVRQEDIEKGLRTPEKIQCHIYHELSQNELRRQEEQREDGRCLIPGANGKLKRCPCRIQNPDYVPGGEQPRTLPVSCNNCRFAEYRNTHSVVNFSTFETENDDGEMTTYEPAAISACPTGDTVEKDLQKLNQYFDENFPKLKETAALYLKGYSLTEISEILGCSTSTTYSRIEKIKKLAEGFVDNCIFL